MALCVVSYVDSEGVRHSVEVEASGLYEAATLALRTFQQHDCEPGAASRLDVEVRSSVTHAITVQKVRNWLTGGAKNPKEKILKDRLRAMVAVD